MQRKEKTTAQEERYIFIDSCIQNLQEAHSILKVIKKEPENKLKVPAFNYALILYSMPYRKSRGTHLKNHILEQTFIPGNYRDLHKKITDCRDQIYAHDDLTVKEAEINVFKFQVSGKTFEKIGIKQNFLKGELFPRIDEIILLIEKSLDKMIAEKSRQDQEILLSRKLTNVETNMH